MSARILSPYALTLGGSATRTRPPITSRREFSNAKGRGALGLVLDDLIRPICESALLKYCDQLGARSVDPSFTLMSNGKE